MWIFLTFYPRSRFLSTELKVVDRQTVYFTILIWPVSDNIFVPIFPNKFISTKNVIFRVFVCLSSKIGNTFKTHITQISILHICGLADFVNFSVFLANSSKYSRKLKRKRSFCSFCSRTVECCQFWQVWEGAPFDPAHIWSSTFFKFFPPSSKKQ